MMVGLVLFLFVFYSLEAKKKIEGLVSRKKPSKCCHLQEATSSKARGWCGCGCRAGLLRQSHFDVIAGLIIFRVAKKDCIIEEGTFCMEHWVLCTNNESWNTISKTNDVMYRD